VTYATAFTSEGDYSKVVDAVKGAIEKSAAEISGAIAVASSTGETEGGYLELAFFTKVSAKEKVPTSEDILSILSAALEPVGGFVEVGHVYTYNQNFERSGSMGGGMRFRSRRSSDELISGAPRLPAGAGDESYSPDIVNRPAAEMDMLSQLRQRLEHVKAARQAADRAAEVAESKAMTGRVSLSRTGAGIGNEMRLKSMHSSTVQDSAEAHEQAMVLARARAAKTGAARSLEDQRAKEDVMLERAEREVAWAVKTGIPQLQAEAARAEVAAEEELTATAAKMANVTGLKIETVVGNFSFDAAEAECAVRERTLCSHTQLVQAFLSGVSQCECGWTQTTGTKEEIFLVEVIGQKDEIAKCANGNEFADGITLCAERPRGMLSLEDGFAAHCCAVVD